MCTGTYGCECQQEARRHPQSEVTLFAIRVVSLADARSVLPHRSRLAMVPAGVTVPQRQWDVQQPRLQHLQVDLNDVNPQIAINDMDYVKHGLAVAAAAGGNTATMAGCAAFSAASRARSRASRSRFKR